MPLLWISAGFDKKAAICPLSGGNVAKQNCPVSIEERFCLSIGGKFNFPLRKRNV